jgi:ABC-type lipoprotein export system ATPase subunit
MGAIIELIGAGRVFSQGAVRTEALKPTTLTIAAGEFIAVTGASGSGKSTFLNLISGVDRATAGRVIVDGTELGGLSEGRLARYRGAKVGIVFQFFELIPTLTARENVVLAMDLVGTIPSGERRVRASELLEKVGLAAHAGKLPSQMSGGEQQRVAIARALANNPPIVIADEPTGNLDQRNGEIVAGLFKDCVADGRAVIVATHESRDLSRYSRILHIADGAFAPGMGAAA